MAKMVWHATGAKTYQYGVDMGALFVVQPSGSYGQGVPWNGLRKVEKKPEGGEQTKFYADNTVYATLSSAESMSGTIEAYAYPKEFNAAMGVAELAPGAWAAGQSKAAFGMVHRSLIGNEATEEAGYDLHIFYGCKVKPTTETSETKGESPSLAELSWEFTCTPVSVTKKPGITNLSYLRISSKEVQEDKLKQIEDAIFGGDSGEPKLLMPDEIFTIISG